MLIELGPRAAILSILLTCFTVLSACGSGLTVRSAQPDPSPTPEPLSVSTDNAHSVPDYVRIDLDHGVVVAFTHDPKLGRLAYVTHVPSGAQAVLDVDNKVIQRHDPQSKGGGALEEALADVNAMSRIQGGLQYEGAWPRNAIQDWLNLIRFDDTLYYMRSKITDEPQMDQSMLGPVLYRVAFGLDANLLPSGYQAQNGDAALLALGTPIYSIDGYSPFDKLAAIVEGEVWLFER